MGTIQHLIDALFNWTLVVDSSVLGGTAAKFRLQGNLVDIKVAAFRRDRAQKQARQIAIKVAEIDGCEPDVPPEIAPVKSLQGPLKGDSPEVWRGASIMLARQIASSKDLDILTKVKLLLNQTWIMLNQVKYEEVDVEAENVLRRLCALKASLGGNGGNE